MTDTNQKLREALRRLYVAAPTSLECKDFHHSKRKQHKHDQECQPASEYLAALKQAVEALSAQAVPDERDKVDAERYRWLRDESFSDIWDFGGCYPRTGLDAAIDAAIKALED